MRSSIVRRLPIPARLLVTLGVPLLALCAVLGAQVNDAREAGAAARSGLSRAIVLRAAAELQSCVVQPETTANGLRPALIAQSDVASAFTLTGVVELITQACRSAEQDLAAVMKKEPGVMTPAATAAFAAEIAALQPVLAGDLGSAAIELLSHRRDVADNALTDMFIATQTTVPFFVYQGIIELKRARWFHCSAVLVALTGNGPLDAPDIAALTGAMSNAVDRTRFATNAITREQVTRLIASPAYTLYFQGAAAAVRIASGQQRPVSGQVVVRVGAAGLSLADSLTAISDNAQQAVTDHLRAQAAQAKQRERLALGIAGATLIATLLAAAAALQSILRPLRDLTRRAKELADGQLDGDPLPQVGRDELTRLASALEGSAAALLHVNRQSQAIADGRLDDPSLETAAPGPFGAVLHSNVLAVQVQASRLRHDAEHDPLTGLLNRPALVRAVERDGQDGTPGQVTRWLLYLDLDGFKQINDRYGHEQGDDVLRAVSERLLRAVRPGDLVARLGGDEFAVVLTMDATDAVHAPGELERAVERVSLAVCTPVRRRSDGESVQVGVSIGRAPIPVAVNGFDDALAAADAQMYEVKRAGRVARQLASPIR